MASRNRVPGWSGVHVYRTPVRFGDCDPAGIVYFPKFFDVFHQAMESWFDEGLRLPYAEVIHGRKIGFPAVHSEADFLAPSRMGEELLVEVRVAKMGRSSIELAYGIRGAREPPTQPRVTGRTICVVMDLDPKSPSFRRAVAIPDDLRERVQQFQGGS